MLYNDFTITISKRQGAGYPVSAVVQELGRAAGKLSLISANLKSLLAQVGEQQCTGENPELIRSAGIALFRWLIAGPLETQLRIAWDRAEQMGRGLRLRLSIDSPAVAALPWELLHDPQRNHTFATSIHTPLVRFLDQTERFGALVEQEAELPLSMLLVLPEAADLDLAQEKAAIERAIAPLAGAITLRVLDGRVTRTALSDALTGSRYDIVHMTGHGGFLRDQGYIALNRADGTPDWVNGNAAARLFANQPALKLLVLNVCSSGQVHEGSGFRGLAPQLVACGIPAVAAMQYPLTDQAALLFAREFYHHLCSGENAGQVDLAIAHARNMLAAAHLADWSFAAPVLYTHAANGVIFRLSHERAVLEVLEPSSERARLAMFMSSLQSSLDFCEDWEFADLPVLDSWRRMLLWAEQAYSTHLSDPRPAAQQAAQHGLGLVQGRLADIERALASGR